MVAEFAWGALKGAACIVLFAAAIPVGIFFWALRARSE